MMRLGMAVLAMCVFACGLMADVAPNPLITGGATVSGMDMKDTPVSMDWEEVDLYPSAQKNSVTAVFLLKNTSDKETTLQVGFPAYGEMPLKDFVVEIDGQKAAAELKKEDLTFKVGPMKKTRHMEWMVWPMTFAGGAEKKVKVTYWVAPEIARGWTHHEVINGRPTTVVDELPNVAATSLPADVKAKVGALHSGYVLHTGAGWHGKIGKAVLRLHYGDEVRKDQLVFTAGEGKWAYDDKTNVDTLTLADFEPTEQSDIAYQYRVLTQEEQYKLLAEGLRKGQLDAPTRILVLGMVQSGKCPKDLSEADRAKLLIETMEFVVPPQGAAIDWSKSYPRLENEIQAVYDKLLAQYKATGQKDKAQALADAYAKSVDALTEGYAGRYIDKWIAQRKAHWATQKAAFAKAAAAE
jgi:hypothetical protein